MSQLKVLYFEGAGMDFYEGAKNHSNVGNFRIRTAFTNLDSKQIYLELSRCNRYRFISKYGKELKKPKLVTEYALYIDHIFEIVEGENDNENKNSIKIDRNQVRELDYSKEDITKWINENLNCNFDTMEVLDYFYGYRVHAENRGYNLMENIDINHERATKRKETYNKIDTEYRKVMNEKYSVISLKSMDNESITIWCHASDQKIGKLEREKRIEIA